MSGSEPPPQRVRITSPRTSPTRARNRPPTSEIDAQTRLGEVYMSSLLRSQLRLALGILGFVGVTLGGLPLLFLAAPGLQEVEVVGMPLPWVLLGFAVYPFLIACGWVYVRAAERNERSFEDVVSGGDA